MDNNSRYLLEGKRPIFLLSIAGGGMRGTIAAQFLKHLEQNTGCRVVDIFDMFAGCSIGSLVMGNLVYTSTTAQELADYIFTHPNAKKIMNKSWCDLLLGRIQTRPYYDGKGKTEFIDKYVGETKIKNTNKNVMFVSYDINNKKPKFFKSWDPKDSDVTVKDAADSSSAAPCFFPSIKVDDGWYMDGGICANYPTDCMYADALGIYGKDADIRVLCIGSGYQTFDKIGNKSQQWGSVQWVGEGGLLDMIMDGSERTTNYRMDMFTKALGHQFLRINEYIEPTSMDDVSEHNIEYLKSVGDQWWELYGGEVMELLKY